MAEHTRLILGFRAAGLLIIGLASPGAAQSLFDLVQHEGVRAALMRGHPDAVLGYIARVLEAVSRSGGLKVLSPLLFLGVGIAMVHMPFRRAQGIMQALERR